MARFLRGLRDLCLRSAFRRRRAARQTASAKCRDLDDAAKNVGKCKQRDAKTRPRRTDVAKHERKEEGKGDDGERRRIDLAIARDAVRLDDRLKRRRDLVRQKVPGRNEA